MQPELPAFDFADQAEVRSNAERRRTEEVTALLKDLFDGWTAKLRRWERPVFATVSHARRPVRAGN